MWIFIPNNWPNEEWDIKKDPWILGVKEMNEDTMDELAPRAEIFRSKLIEDFQLIDRVANSSGAEPPKYYSNEITGICFFTIFCEIFQVCCLATNHFWSNISWKLFASKYQWVWRWQSLESNKSLKILLPRFQAPYSVFEIVDFFK